MNALMAGGHLTSPLDADRRLSREERVAFAELVAGITRRRFIAGSMALAALGACGRQGEDSGDGDRSRVVQTALGPVDVPARPQRVVTLGYEASVTLDLGVIPVGMARESFDESGIASYNRDLVSDKDVSLLDTSSELPYEQIAALRPDVILAGTYFDVESAYERLSAIAPTVTFVAGSFKDTWQEQAMLIGETLGKETEARRAVDALDARIAEIASGHPGWAGKTFSASFNYDVGTITTITNPEDFAIKLLTQLGLRLSPRVATLAGDDIAAQPDVSYELVEALDADVVLMAHASDELSRSLEAQPLFANLASVREGRLITFDLVTVAALRTPMLRGIHHALDFLEPELERALGR